LRGAAKTAHQQYLASGNSLAAATLWGRAVSLKNGYPDASSRGIRAAIIDWTGFTTKATSNSIIFMKTGAANAEQCAVVYSVAEPQLTEASLTQPAVDGC
jgi:hypothetical protein